MVRRREQRRGQGGSLGDEYITYEIERNKAQRLAEWLNEINIRGYELVALEGYGGGGSVYLMAVARKKQR